MLRWLFRGLGQGRITTSYPRDGAPSDDGFSGRIVVLDAIGADRDLAQVCPTGAVNVDREGRVALDRGRCILCGECVRTAPTRFAFAARHETAARSRSALVVPQEGFGEQAPTRATLGELAPALRRSIHVRHIDCGSDGAEEWEIQALWNPYYDIQRLGFFLTPAPRHADVLLVTGGVTAPMRAPLERTWQVMPEPKALVAVGTDACSGGMAADGELVAGGVDQVLPVDVYVPGSPPSPIAILHGLLLAVGLLTDRPVAA
jgi:Ni,Fe-hydrogenase III small subunit/formate hydrogenlyase subunit 6/NADH:ubiquinone oxidoreductase subunit I